MKNLFVLLATVALVFSASGQKVYFMYFQSEENAAFYIKLGDKVFSSTSPGYLIIPNLLDTTYNVLVGLPAVSSESRFSLNVNSKERGLLINNNN
jgi:hypothetical protein